MFTLTLKIEGPIHVHLHEAPPTRDPWLHAVLDKLDQVLQQGASMTTQGQQIQELLQRVYDNSNAEAAVNVRQTKAIDTIKMRIDDLVSQVNTGTPGVSSEEAAGFIATLESINEVLERVKGDEVAQAQRLELMGDPNQDVPVPDPVTLPPPGTTDPLEDEDPADV